jgi:hypothetical protein
LKTVVTESNIVATGGIASQLTALLFTKLHSLWHQVGHSESSTIAGLFSEHSGIPNALLFELDSDAHSANKAA